MSVAHRLSLYFTSERFITLLFEGGSLVSDGMTTGDRRFLPPKCRGLSVGGERCLALPAG
jgi:hypothetical protein